MLDQQVFTELRWRCRERQVELVITDGPSASPARAARLGPSSVTVRLGKRPGPAQGSSPAPRSGRAEGRRAGGMQVIDAVLDGPAAARRVQEELWQRIDAAFPAMPEVAPTATPPRFRRAGTAPMTAAGFARVLARVEKRAGRRVVQGVLEALWASRAGLFQDELLAITKVAPAQWTRLRKALGALLDDRGGGIRLGADPLRKTLADRYGLADGRRRQAHRRLAVYFQGRPLDARVAEELAWQWEQAGEAERLKACLLDLDCFACLVRAGVPCATLLRWWEVADPGELGMSYFQVLLQAWSTNREGRTGPLPEPDAAFEDLAWKGHCVVDFLASAGWRGAAISAAGLQCESVEDAGREHPATWRALRDLARTITRFAWFGEDGRMHEAEAKCERALAIATRALGARHPETLLLGLELARCRHEQRGGRRDALGLARTAVAGLAEVLGSGHVETLKARGFLAQVLRDTGEFRKAEALLQEVVRGLERALGPEHPDTLTAVRHLAKCLSHRDDYTAAEALYRRVLAGRTRVLGPRHLDTLKAMVNLATVCAKQQQWPEAEALCRAALPGLRSMLGSAHWNTRRAGDLLGSLLLRAGRAAEAEPLLRECYEREKRAAAGSMGAKMAAVAYADCLGRLRRRGESLDLLRAEQQGDMAWLAGLALAEQECASGNVEGAWRIVLSILQRQPGLYDVALDQPGLLPLRSRLRDYRRAR
jgi:tetratricopeptide (TPR) repeat protein